jgi:hypothetical protein
VFCNILSHKKRTGISETDLPLPVRRIIRSSRLQDFNRRLVRIISIVMRFCCTKRGSCNSKRTRGLYKCIIEVIR